MILEGRELTVRYDGASVPALDGVSLRVTPRELLAVCGPNGSGKTTLVRALLGLVPLNGGAALLDERPVAEWRGGSLAKVVGVVAQREDIVFPLTVAQMVLLGRYPHLGPLAPEGPQDREAVLKALRRCDVERLAKRRVDTLSGGEWQLVRLARALAQQPRILVLDEPTASLDVRHEMELFELVRGLVRDGLAGLVITHELNLAARFADRIVLLDEGRVAAEGSPAEVFRSDTLERIFQWPVSVATLPDGSPQVVPERKVARTVEAVSEGR
ncbi:MAG TPA: ABC transporter ATP-binding protein [Gemmatimonadales bacterium]|nr:ABC transporter ATP-binding protein [Gemmatimonadales bacterium]